jgi:death on curing protein
MQPFSLSARITILYSDASRNESMDINYLVFEEVVQLHDLLCFLCGGKNEILNRDAIESALAQPRMAMFGEEFFPTLYKKAAAYCYYLCLNHGFQDGNKRAAVGAAFHFLRKNGQRPCCSQDALYDAVMRVIDHRCTVEELAAILEGVPYIPPDSAIQEEE